MNATSFSTATSVQKQSVTISVPAISKASTKPESHASSQSPGTVAQQGGSRVQQSAAGTDASSSDARSDSGPIAASVAPHLGYKDEMEMRYIWDRVLGRGRHGTVTRVVVDRYSGVEYACKCMPKAPPPPPDGNALTGAELEAATQEHLLSIKREITMFVELRSSLNVAKLQHIYEDASHVFLVMQLCRGPTLAEAAASRPHSEREVAAYVKSIVKTIAQCHEKGFAHGAVSPDKFMFMGVERASPLKAIGFGKQARLATDTIFQTLSTVAPEALSSQPSIMSNKADQWAAGLVAARLLTGYFPFDDVLQKMVEKTGILGPLVDRFDTLEMMPSVAALFVAGTVMLLDMTRPQWQPVSDRAKDFVLKSLEWEASKRMTAIDALSHAWLKWPGGQRLSKPGAETRAPLTTVQRIQRFGSFGPFKRTALEHIAGQLRSGDALGTPRHEGSGSSLSLERSGTAVGGVVAEQGAHADLAASGQRPASALQSSEAYASLVQHLDRTSGVVDEASLGSALSALGYDVSPDTLAHLLEQLSAVSTFGESTVTSDALAASQIDWRNIQADDAGSTWQSVTRVAFDALDVNGDGLIQRSEIAHFLAAKIPAQDMQAALDQAMVDSGQDAGAQALDFDAFVHLLESDTAADDERSLLRFSSLHPAGASLVSGTTSTLRALNRTLTTHLRKTLARELAPAPSVASHALQLSSATMRLSGSLSAGLLSDNRPDSLSDMGDDRTDALDVDDTLRRRDVDGDSRVEVVSSQMGGVALQDARGCTVGAAAARAALLGDAPAALVAHFQAPEGVSGQLALAEAGEGGGAGGPPPLTKAVAGGEDGQDPFRRFLAEPCTRMRTLLEATPPSDGSRDTYELAAQF